MNELGPLVEMFANLSPWTASPKENCVGNFLGTMIDQEFLELIAPSNVLSDAPGETPGARMPKVTDGEAFFEFASIFKAVSAARERFVMVELGGGYAARSVDAHRLLEKLNPMPSQLTIVEPEPTHFEWAKRHMITNGIDPLEHWLINTAVSASSDPRLFMLGSGLYYNGIVETDDIKKAIQLLINRKKTPEVLRNLMLGGRCGMRLSYESAAGKDLFDLQFVSALPLADILAPL